MKEEDNERRRRLRFVVKVMALIPYYERDLNIIKRAKMYKYTKTRANNLKKKKDNKGNPKYSLIVIPSTCRFCCVHMVLVRNINF